MKASPQNIWSTPAYLPYLQPKITSQIIRDAEQRIGFNLPSEYLALLEVQNGGYIRYSLEDLVHEMIYGIGPNFPSITDIRWEDAKECVSFPLDGLVPFDGDGHWFICLDYRKNPKAPLVSYIDIECDSESIIANSFKEYLQLLKRVIPENDYVITSTADLEFVKEKLAKSLQVKFGDPDTYAHGYPIHRARVDRLGSPEWISLNANIVPRGFVRKDDNRYEELCSLMPGEAAIHPELPGSCCLLYAAEGIRKKVLNALREESIEVKPLADFLK